MQTVQDDSFDQSGNRRTDPYAPAMLILLVITIEVIGSLPTFAQKDTQGIGAVQLESSQPRQLVVSWGEPTDIPRDHRVD